MPVVVKVPTRRANAPKLASLPGAGLGIQRGLVKKCSQSSLGTMGAASRRMKAKMAAMPRMLLHPQSRISHSTGFSTASKRLNDFRFAAVVVGAEAAIGLEVPAWTVAPGGRSGTAS